MLRDTDIPPPLPTFSPQVVLADGSMMTTGTRARKSAAGYDLTRLLVGSEGTLGIITEATLRLQHVPPHSAVAMCCFPSVRDAANTAIAAAQSGVPVRGRGVCTALCVRCGVMLIVCCVCVGERRCTVYGVGLA